MSKLKEERLNQMIENALSYKQEVKILIRILSLEDLKSSFLNQKFMDSLLPRLLFLTFLFLKY